MPKLNLDRQMLVKILGNNHQAIVAFEQVLEYVGDTGPEGIAEILALINSIRRTNTSAITARLDDHDQQPAPRINLSAVNARLDAFEQQAAQRTNLTAILARLDKLEQFLGV